jgi:hypothetical protein
MKTKYVLYTHQYLSTPKWGQIHFQVYHFSGLLLSQGVLNKDPTVWQDGARPSPMYNLSALNMCWIHTNT